MKRFPVLISAGIMIAASIALGATTMSAESCCARSGVGFGPGGGPAGTTAVFLPGHKATAKTATTANAATVLTAAIIFPEIREGVRG